MRANNRLAWWLLMSESSTPSAILRSSASNWRSASNLSLSASSGPRSASPKTSGLPCNLAEPRSAPPFQRIGGRILFRSPCGFDAAALNGVIPVSEFS